MGNSNRRLIGVSEKQEGMTFPLVDCSGIGDLDQPVGGLWRGGGWLEGEDVARGA